MPKHDVVALESSACDGQNTDFIRRKAAIINSLATPPGDYHDQSPKGSVDGEIREMIEDINRLDGCVTTSSCAGRAAVFLEGAARQSSNVCNSTDADRDVPLDTRKAFRKGEGGHWLFVTHSQMQSPKAAINDGAQEQGFTKLFQLVRSDDDHSTPSSEAARFVHLKFEPMILHVLTASLVDAQKLLSAGSAAGFRESGCVSITAPCPMVAIRCQGLSLDSVIGYLNPPEESDLSERDVPPQPARAIVDEAYLHTLVNIVNSRFKENSSRIERFARELRRNFSKQSGIEPTGWEDARTRRERKRTEGLATRERLKNQQE
ncbi:MAG: hypothetical protein M1828_002656 [Chrysothrix sp. TS-e1954]|nr:MAG: hypothetical protein M1828_002656 [Chrysothrix sp. TS-e1954]